ncbi:hypothetical protein SISSUDRAFT_654169 [Sistotremastrum suecicum HHB10207 ss-3]|uniref:Uncharacterized protein n=1 Tax=Sistotremastrum suecicum HHB10207 ss-3 TaxID=1314776 RepID=A0A166E9D6_9AGAM|nr:hypothetical protein SISSUDRAFT_654169 [Sistotremastrum suecicum HHB10207 ss-3]
MSASSLRRRSSGRPSAFDQWPQPEFESWITGITNKIRTGLTPQDQPTHSPVVSDGLYTASLKRRASLSVLENEKEEYSSPVKVWKGKERDESNGPGLAQLHASVAKPTVDIAQEDSLDDDDEEAEVDYHLFAHSPSPVESSDSRGEPPEYLSYSGDEEYEEDAIQEVRGDGADDPIEISDEESEDLAQPDPRRHREFSPPRESSPLYEDEEGSVSDGDPPGMVGYEGREEDEGEYEEDEDDQNQEPSLRRPQSQRYAYEGEEQNSAESDIDGPEDHLNRVTRHHYQEDVEEDELEENDDAGEQYEMTERYSDPHEDVAYPVSSSRSALHWSTADAMPIASRGITKSKPRKDVEVIEIDSGSDEEVEKGPEYVEDVEEIDEDLPEDHPTYRPRSPGDDGLQQAYDDEELGELPAEGAEEEEEEPTPSPIQHPDIPEIRYEDEGPPSDQFPEAVPTLHGAESDRDQDSLAAFLTPHVSEPSLFDGEDEEGYPPQTWTSAGPSPRHWEDGNDNEQAFFESLRHELGGPQSQELGYLPEDVMYLSGEPPIPLQPHEPFLDPSLLEPQYPIETTASFATHPSFPSEPSSNSLPQYLPPGFPPGELSNIVYNAPGEEAQEAPLTTLPQHAEFGSQEFDLFKMAFSHVPNLPEVSAAEHNIESQDYAPIPVSQEIRARSPSPKVEESGEDASAPVHTPVALEEPSVSGPIIDESANVPEELVEEKPLQESPAGETQPDFAPIRQFTPITEAPGPGTSYTEYVEVPDKPPAETLFAPEAVMEPGSAIEITVPALPAEALQEQESEQEELKEPASDVADQPRPEDEAVPVPDPLLSFTLAPALPVHHEDEVELVEEVQHEPTPTDATREPSVEITSPDLTPAPIAALNPESTSQDSEHLVAEPTPLDSVQGSVPPSAPPLFPAVEFEPEDPEVVVRDTATEPSPLEDPAQEPFDSTTTQQNDSHSPAPELREPTQLDPAPPSPEPTVVVKPKAEVVDLTDSPELAPHELDDHAPQGDVSDISMSSAPRDERDAIELIEEDAETENAESDGESDGDPPHLTKPDHIYGSEEDSHSDHGDFDELDEVAKFPSDAQVEKGSPSAPFLEAEQEEEAEEILPRKPSPEIIDVDAESLVSESEALTQPRPEEDATEAHPEDRSPSAGFAGIDHDVADQPVVHAPAAEAVTGGTPREDRDSADDTEPNHDLRASPSNEVAPEKEESKPISPLDTSSEVFEVLSHSSSPASQGSAEETEGEEEIREGSLDILELDYGQPSSPAIIPEVYEASTRSPSAGIGLAQDFTSLDDADVPEEQQHAPVVIDNPIPPPSGDEVEVGEIARSNEVPAPDVIFDDASEPNEISQPASNLNHQRAPEISAEEFRTDDQVDSEAPQTATLEVRLESSVPEPHGASALAPERSLPWTSENSEENAYHLHGAFAPEQWLPPATAVQQAVVDHSVEGSLEDHLPTAAHPQDVEMSVSMEEDSNKGVTSVSLTAEPLTESCEDLKARSPAGYDVDTEMERLQDTVENSVLQEDVCPPYSIITQKPLI